MQVSIALGLQVKSILRRDEGDRLISPEVKA